MHFVAGTAPAPTPARENAGWRPTPRPARSNGGDALSKCRWIDRRAARESSARRPALKTNAGRPSASNVARGESCHAVRARDLRQTSGSASGGTMCRRRSERSRPQVTAVVVPPPPPHESREDEQRAERGRRFFKFISICEEVLSVQRVHHPRPAVSGFIESNMVSRMLRREAITESDVRPAAEIIALDGVPARDREHLEAEILADLQETAARRTARPRTGPRACRSPFDTPRRRAYEPAPTPGRSLASRSGRRFRRPAACRRSGMRTP